MCVGNYAYATNLNGLRIIDVSNKGQPVSASFFALPTPASGITIAGDCAYVTAFYHFHILDVRNKNSPFQVGESTLPEISAREIAIAGDYAYFANGRTGMIISRITGTNAVYLPVIMR